MSTSSRVTFLTSSMGTRWTPYSQALLAKKFPEFRRVLVDGSTNWNPLYFVAYCKESASEYSVLVDEDCFILDRAQLFECLARMDKCRDVAVMGTPDGGTFHRHLNPVACNTFFMIVRNSALSDLDSDLSWKDLTYEQVKQKSSLSHIVHLDSTRVDYVLSEPYYPFFWYILKSNWKIEYIIPEIEPGVIASRYSVRQNSKPLFLHMWWLRQWFSKSIDPYLKTSNFSRYQQLENNWLANEFNDYRSRLILLSQKIVNQKNRIRRLIDQLRIRGSNRA